MPLVNRKCIEDIKDRVDIHDVVAPYVNLKRTGAHWKGLSPFTSEKSPSFFVMPDKGIFKCFSSGYAGDIFRFLQLKENLSFQEAIESIAHRYNITLEYEEGGSAQTHSMSLKKELLEIHEYATHFFHKCLLSENPTAEIIRKYWTEKRNFSLDIANEYKIGFAPDDKFMLINYLQKKHKYSIEALKQCGLFYSREHDMDPSRFMSRFRGRLTIPVRDVQGRVIAFACRQLQQTPKDDPAADAKYINSPETPIFNKSKTLYGLEHARQHVEKTGYIVLVEGQLDAIRCHSCGIDTAVAPQGTAITELQLATLRRYTTKVYVVLDGDDAGQKAALRIIPMSLKAGLDIAFIPLIGKEDPDSLLASGGPEALLSRLPNAMTLVEFALKSHLPTKATPQQKSVALKHLYEMLILCTSAVAREEYLLELAKLTHTNRQNIEADFVRFKMAQKGSLTQSEKKQTQREEKGKEKLTSAEYQLLLMILNHEDIAHSLGEIIDPDWVQQDNLEGRLLIRLLAEIREDLWRGKSSLDELIETDEERNFLYSILSEDIPFEDPLKTANIILKTLYQKYLHDKKTTIESQIAKASNDDMETLRSLQKQRIELRSLSNTPPTIDIPSQTPA